MGQQDKNRFGCRLECRLRCQELLQSQAEVEFGCKSEWNLPGISSAAGLALVHSKVGSTAAAGSLRASSYALRP